MALPANIFATSQADLDRLVAESAPEGPHMDFKRDLPLAGWPEAPKIELLADVTALANAGGGDVIYGIDEDGNARAAAVVPQVLANADQTVRQIQDILVNNVEPRMPGLQVRAVAVTVSGVAGYVVVVRVPESWAGPHRETVRKNFYAREGARKRQLSVPEIRGLFLRSEGQAKRVRDFRTERLGKILAGEAPQKLVEGPLVVAHLVPAQAALGLVQVDPVPYANTRQLLMLGDPGNLARLNVDGALVTRNVTEQGTHGYTQFFRDGFLEATKVYPNRGDRPKAVLPPIVFEQHVVNLLTQFRAELAFLEVAGDIAVMVSILHADKLQLGSNPIYDLQGEQQSHFDRAVVVLPDVLVGADAPVERALRAVFDLVWQAAGFNGSSSYNDAGDWVPRR